MEVNLENLFSIIFTIGGIVAAILIGFFTWVILFLKKQNSSEKDSLLKDAEIEKRISVSDEKIKSLDYSIKGIEKKIEIFTTDLAEFRGYLKEDNALILNLTKNVERLERGIVSIGEKFDVVLLKIRGEK